MQIINNPFEIGVWYKIEIDKEGLYRIDHEVTPFVMQVEDQYDRPSIKLERASRPDLIEPTVPAWSADCLDGT